MKAKAAGLIAEQLRLSGVIKRFYYLTSDTESAQSDKFAKQSVELVETQMAHTAGFFVITGGSTPSEAVRAGMRFQAFWLEATAEGISIHPVSQILEEMPWAEEVMSALELGESVQMLCACRICKKLRGKQQDPASAGRFCLSS